jgi:glycosyltransferase involved in cell wall biosynthesis
MRIAVDAGALAQPGNGIARYLRAMLEHLLPLAPQHHWTAYARARLHFGAVMTPLQQCHDHLPAGLGRVAALATTLPWWTARDRPDLFWGPAHRLPLYLPPTTARVVTIHDLCWREAPQTMRATTRRLDAWLMPRALRAADRVIAVSQATADDLRTAFPDVAARVVVVPEAATALPTPGTRASLEAFGIDRRYVLFVGTLEPRKNLPRLLQAFARVAPGTLLVLAGGRGWGDAALRGALAAAGVGERVRVLGAVDDARLATLYRHAHCLALPSLYEGFGLPLLESLAQGTPVLTADRASMPELAGSAGLCVDPYSVDAIANGLARLLDDAALHARLAAAATAQAARYSWASAARATLTVFEDAVRTRAARADG